jgi:hypothetical protein
MRFAGTTFFPRRIDRLRSDSPCIHFGLIDPSPLLTQSYLPPSAGKPPSRTTQQAHIGISIQSAHKSQGRAREIGEYEGSFLIYSGSTAVGNFRIGSNQRARQGAFLVTSKLTYGGKPFGSIGVRTETDAAALVFSSRRREAHERTMMLPSAR